MTVKVRSRGRNATGRSRSGDRWSKNRPTTTRLVSFGKHLGKPYADVPLGYLRWMIRAKCKDATHATAEIERRQRSAREVSTA